MRMNKAFDKIVMFIDEQIKIEESIAKSKNEGHPITHQYGANCMNVIKKFVQEVAEEYNDGWISCSEKFPDNESYILLSFDNFSVPCVGRYKQDESGGAFYIGDDDETCISQDLYVNAWQPLPVPYKE